MTFRSISLTSLQTGVDLTFRMLPQPVPVRELLRKVKIISHRGEHNNRDIIENTIPAFTRSLRSGVWGIELDIRWTADLQPVVIHDADAKRLFNKDIKIANVTRDFLNQHIPEIPTLQEVIRKFGHKLHLMIELKKEHLPDPVQQNQILSTILSSLIPCKDYHLLALDPILFEHLSFVPSGTFLPVSEMNTKKLSRMALQKKLGGVTGHYLLLSDRMVENHHKINQNVGTGFVSSKNTLFREINRGVNWIFSNRAAALQKIINDCLRYGIT